ncbi:MULTISPECIES: helix-turn-helix transcriptional regulator [Gordonibacter]|uniref:Helix-turn-helix transcriptional regulator n=1 Tax=Gordonibacter faecis TaxID=3047475 RepID=A0ABT7DM40_9ACTN|nr:MULTISPECIES: helix-turn-helix transcriptional regulator [unclassified Gordonibacter]MDJ1650605.1 helix-turn-helix transcriptional regulator [Gordonibacter sp. KGMB12511]
MSTASPASRALSAAPETTSPAMRGHLVLCTIALAVSFAEYWLLNYCAFPLFDSVYIWTREASAIAGGIALSAIAFVSYWRPHLFDSGRFFGASAAVMIAGSLLVAAGLALRQSALLVAGASLVTVGTGLANIVVGIGCIGLGMRRLGVAVTSAYVLAYASRGLFSLVPGEANLTLFCLLPLGSLALMAPAARPLFNQIFTEGSPAQAAVTAPKSFLPFGHQVFITLLIFRFIYGYTLTFGEVDRVPLLALGALAPLALVAVYVIASRRELSPDRLFQLSILCSVAGFLMLSIAHVQGSVTSMVLSCGTGFFEMLMYYVLIALGAKNTLNALPLLAWGNAMASWGTLLGANFGRFTNVQAADPSAVSAIASVVVFGIVAYVVLVQKTFSFTSTINGVAPLVPLVTAPVAATGDAEAGATSASTLEQRCAAIGAAHGLTDREQEIFEYLARGRNVRFIQEALVVSYNTVKTHVSHVYAKLDVHSHQELIDLVERTQ